MVLELFFGGNDLFYFLVIMVLLNVIYIRNPRIAPYHRVANLMMMAAPTAMVDDRPNITNNPDRVASATPNPPGIRLTAPASEAKLNTKVDNTMPMFSPNP